MKQEMYNVLTDVEFDQIVNDHYNPIINFESTVTDGYKNNSDHTFEIEKDELSDYDTDKLNKVISGQPVHLMVGIILQDLINKDVLPEGRYLIEVYW